MDAEIRLLARCLTDNMADMGMRLIQYLTIVTLLIELARNHTSSPSASIHRYTFTDVFCS